MFMKTGTSALLTGRNRLNRIVNTILSAKAQIRKRSIFKRLIDIRKDLNIHPLIDVRLLEKTEQDRNLSFPKRLAEFAEQQKAILVGDFDEERDRMVIIFDADFFEEKVSGYEEFVLGNDEKFLTMDCDGRYSYAYQCLLQKTGMNAKKNSRIGLLADNCLLAIRQEKLVNQDVHSVKGKVSSNIGKIIESIINDEP